MLRKTVNVGQLHLNSFRFRFVDEQQGIPSVRHEVVERFADVNQLIHITMSSFIREIAAEQPQEIVLEARLWRHLVQSVIRSSGFKIHYAYWRSAPSVALISSFK